MAVPQEWPSQITLLIILERPTVLSSMRHYEEHCKKGIESGVLKQVATAQRFKFGENAKSVTNPPKPKKQKVTKKNKKVTKKKRRK